MEQSGAVGLSGWWWWCAKPKLLSFDVGSICYCVCPGGLNCVCLLVCHFSGRLGRLVWLDSAQDQDCKFWYRSINILLFHRWLLLLQPCLCLSLMILAWAMDPLPWKFQGWSGWRKSSVPLVGCIMHSPVANFIFGIKYVIMLSNTHIEHINLWKSWFLSRNKIKFKTLILC